MYAHSVIFDLDGTLVDSVQQVAQILNCMRSERGLPSLTIGDYRLWSSRGGNHLVGNALGLNPSQASAQVAEFRSRYMNLTTSPECTYRGVVSSLKTLNEAKCRLAICSNKPERLCLKVLEETGLRSFFVAVVGGDSTPFSKPNSYPLNEALRLVGASASRSLFVGDSTIDQKTAAAAEVPFVFFKGGYNDGVDESACFAVIDDFDEILKVLISRPAIP